MVRYRIPFVAGDNDLQFLPSPEAMGENLTRLWPPRNGGVQGRINRRLGAQRPPSVASVFGKRRFATLGLF